jgi:hypothetical protein
MYGVRLYESGRHEREEESGPAPGRPTLLGRTKRVLSEERQARIEESAHSVGGMQLSSQHGLRRLADGRPPDEGQGRRWSCNAALQSVAGRGRGGDGKIEMQTRTSSTRSEVRAANIKRDGGSGREREGVEVVRRTGSSQEWS